MTSRLMKPTGMSALMATKGGKRDIADVALLNHFRHERHLIGARKQL
jgi:hypothetical protein